MRKEEGNPPNLIVDASTGMGVILLVLGICYSISEFTGYEFVHILVGVPVLLVGFTVTLGIFGLIGEMLHRRDEY